jgi:hypothetical protein
MTLEARDYGCDSAIQMNTLWFSRQAKDDYAGVFSRVMKERVGQATIEANEGPPLSAASIQYVRVGRR